MYIKKVNIRLLGLQEWESISRAMYKFTINRTKSTLDELWFTEHYPIFTKGKIGKNEKVIFSNSNIPVLCSNRGGNITYHGPGQLLMYVLIDLLRRNMNLKQLISFIETSIIQLLLDLSITSYINKSSPGIYVEGKKICSIGLRIIKGCSLHGLSINVDMNLLPFNYINPCGIKNLKMIKISTLKPNISINTVRYILVKKCLNILNVEPIYYYQLCSTIT